MKFLVLVIIITTLLENIFCASDLGLGDHSDLLPLRKSALPNSGFMTHGLDAQRKCEPIAIPFCQGLPYNMTQFPNSFGHLKQEEALSELRQFLPLMKVNCAPDLTFFLCSLYAPICTPDYPQILLPCRSLCIEARSGCTKIMSKFGFDWPANLNCDDPGKFPVFKDDICVHTNRSMVASKNDETRPRPAPSERRPHSNLPGSAADGGDLGFLDRFHKNLGSVENEGASGEVGERPIDPFAPNLWDGKSRFACPSKMKARFPDYSVYVANESVSFCGIPCNLTMFFSWDQVRILKGWILGWSSLCAVSTLMTILTFAIEPSRFVYPERSIIFIAFCYFLISIAYISGYGLQTYAACNAESVEKNPPFSGLTFVTQGPRHQSCTILAMTSYFFTISAGLWWVVLTWTWFLEAFHKWGKEGVEAQSHYYHLFTWGISAALTIGVVATKNIDGDPLSGTCGVGNWNPFVMNWFVVAPLVGCLIVGLLLFGTGFVSIFRIRNHFIKGNIAATPCWEPARNGSGQAAYDLALQQQPLTTPLPPVPPLYMESVASGGGASRYEGCPGGGSTVPMTSTLSGWQPGFSAPVSTSRPVSAVGSQAGKARARVEKFERLMIKISIFSVFFNVPSVFMVVCYFYQSLSVQDWVMAWYDGACRRGDYSFTLLRDASNAPFPCPSMQHSTYDATLGANSQQRPEFAVVMVKYFLSLIIGISSGFWVWSAKTLESWKRFFARLCRGKYGAAT